MNFVIEDFNQGIGNLRKDPDVKNAITWVGNNAFNGYLIVSNTYENNVRIKDNSRLQKCILNNSKVLFEDKRIFDKETQTYVFYVSSSEFYQNKNSFPINNVHGYYAVYGCDSTQYELNSVYYPDVLQALLVNIEIEKTEKSHYIIKKHFFGFGREEKIYSGYKEVIFSGGENLGGSDIWYIKNDMRFYIPQEALKNKSPVYIRSDEDAEINWKCSGGISIRNSVRG